MVVIKPVDTLIQLLRDSFASIGLDRVSTRLGIALLAVSSLFFAANFADKAWVSYQVSQQKQQLITQIQVTEQQITKYTGDLKYMTTRPYYVEQARTFGFVQPGDIPVSISTSSAPAQPVAGAADARTSPINATPKPKAQHDSIFKRIMQAIVPGF